MNIFSLYQLVFKNKVKSWILLALFSSILINIFVACSKPIIFQFIFDNALPHKNIKLLIILISLAILLFFSSIIASFVQYYCSALIGTKVINQLRLKLFRKVQSLTLNESTITEDQLLSRFTKDIAFLEYSLNFVIWLMVEYFSIAFVSALLLFYTDWRLTLVVSLFFPLIFILPKLFLRIANRYIISKEKMDKNIFVLEKENVSMHDVIRFLQLKKYKRMNYKSLLKNHSMVNTFYNANIGLAGRSARFGVNFITLIILGVGIYLVMMPNLSLGELVGFLVLIDNVGSSVSFISSHYPSLQQASISLHAIMSVLNERIDVNKHGQLKMGRLSKNIIFDHVSAYDNHNKPILSDICFTITKGQSVAFVGYSGSGKTTLLNLLFGEKKINKGHIYIDGQDLNSYTLNSSYNQICLVSQRPKLFPTTIEENIRLGKADATMGEIIQAAKDAEIHDEIMLLQNAYQTQVSYETLSSGQYHRIALARALIAKPSILCLDEVYSVLDPITAAALTDTLNKMRGQLTMIYVTHELAPTVLMDKIFVIDKGKIIEEGTHDELMIKNGLYYMLWTKQHGIVLAPDMGHAQIQLSTIKEIGLFSELDDFHLKKIISKFTVERIEADQIVFKENAHGDKFYIIASGSVEVSTLSQQAGFKKIITTLYAGDFFGEIALISDVPRTATVTTKGVCIVLTLSRKDFHEFFKILPKNAKQKIMDSVKSRSSFNI